MRIHFIYRCPVCHNYIGKVLLRQKERVIDFGPSEPPIFRQMPPAPGYSAVISGVDKELSAIAAVPTVATITAVDKDAGKITI